MPTPPAAWYPNATRRPIPNTASPHPGEGKYLHEVAGPFTTAPHGWILHVVVGNGSPFQTFLTAKSPTRRFSHLWFAKDGRVEQYGPFDYKSWAQGTGNGLYLSCETEGVPTEPLTAAQVASLAAFHVWAGFPDTLASAPGQPGIGTHYMGGADWGGHTCPDPDPPGRGPRSHQRAAILTAAAAIRAGKPPEDDMPLTDAEKDDIALRTARAIHSQQIYRATWIGADGKTLPLLFADALLAAARKPFPTAQQVAEAIKATLTSIPAGTAAIDDDAIDKVSDAVLRKLSAKLSE